MWTRDSKSKEEMGSNMNFRNSVDAPPAAANAARFAGVSPLARQPSVYSLTFDEFQNTWGGSSKDLGSMNMDELLKEIWNAEETQAMTSNGGGGGAVEGGSSGPVNNLQKQGSLTLPRTLSQMTVDEVWRQLFKEDEEPSNKIVEEAVPSLPHQRTLGEMTLEEFLARAGVVREEIQTEQIGRVGNNGGFYNDISTTVTNNGYNNNAYSAFKFQQEAPNGPNLALNVPKIQFSQPEPQQQPQLFANPVTVAFAQPMNQPNTSQLANTPAKGVMGVFEPSSGNSVIQFSGITNGGGMSVAAPMGIGSPAGSSQPSPAVSNRSADSPLLSPVPYAFGRGRRPSSALEKVVERRQKRMIKNRESAARSRARKQAYTLELEAEVAKLKELNEELQKKQDELVKMQKNQMLQAANGNLGNKRLCLRRTQTWPSDGCRGSGTDIQVQ